MATKVETRATRGGGAAVVLGDKTVAWIGADGNGSLGVAYRKQLAGKDPDARVVAAMDKAKAARRKKAAAK